MDEHFSPASTIFTTAKTKPNNFFPQTDCLQSRNILALLDFPEESKKIKNLERHLSRCSDCQTQMIAGQHYLRVVDEKVPFLKPNEEMVSALNTELSDIFSRLDLHSTEFTFVQNKNPFRQVEKVFMDFLDLVISWKMVPAYLVALALFMALSTFN